MRLHPAQLAFRRSDALFRGFVGGRGAGKSWCGAFDLLRRLRPGRTYLVGSPTGVLMQDTTFPTFRTLAQDFGVWGGVKLTPYPTATIRLEGGPATVRFRTAEDPEKLRGPNLSGAWLDEASLMHADAHKVVIGCLREGGRQGWSSYTFTPKGMSHWTTELFGADPPPPNVAVFHARTSENPFLPAGFEATVAAQYDDAEARRELGGEFLDLEGMEWPPSYFGPGVWFDDWPAPGDTALTLLVLDPSRGKGERGDYAAYVVVRLDRRHDFWVDAVLMKRGSIFDIVARGVGLIREHRPNRVVVEANIGQELLVAEFDRQMTAAGVVTAVDGVENWTNKEVRIRATLGKYLARGRVRFRRNSPGAKLLVGQLQAFPNGDHDDGPDALELGIRRLELMLNGG